MDGSPPGSPVPGILQAGALEWVPRLLRSHSLDTSVLQVHMDVKVQFVLQRVDGL